MRRKQNLKVRQDMPITSATLSATEALEQQVRSHPVVQEVMRLFNARIAAITQAGVNEGDERPAVEQPMLISLR